MLVSKEESLVVYLYQHIRGALPLRLRTTRPALAGMLGINLRTLYRYTDKLVAAGALSLDRGKLCITQENHIQLEKLYQQIMKKLGKMKSARSEKSERALFLSNTSKRATPSHPRRM